MLRCSVHVIASIMLLCGSVSAVARNHSEQSNYLNSIKATFLSWTSGSTKISYERALPGINQSSEICAGVISAGYDKYKNNPVGFTMRYGHKFFIGLNKDELTLKGFYLRPELVYSYYHYNCTNTHKYDCRQSGERESAAMTAVLGTWGYQYVYKRFLADLWVGAGYAGGRAADTGYHHGFQLWKYFGSTNKNIALSFSLRLGVCF